MRLVAARARLEPRQRLHVALGVPAAAADDRVVDVLYEQQARGVWCKDRGRDVRVGAQARRGQRARARWKEAAVDDAVLTDDDGSYVLIVGPNNTVQRRGIRIATVTDRGVVIAEGLNGNERVVESAGAFLNPGERIRPERAARR